MAAAKELMVVAVDVGASMTASGRKGEAMGIVQQLLLQKMMYAKKDEVALLLAGTRDTANAVAERAGDGSFSHITAVPAAGGFASPSVTMVKHLMAAAAADSSDTVRGTCTQCKHTHTHLTPSHKPHPFTHAHAGRPGGRAGAVHQRGGDGGTRGGRQVEAGVCTHYCHYRRRVAAAGHNGGTAHGNCVTGCQVE